jgi:Arc/MetJ-type ribon-helix-helix transcriptional regulator
MADSTPERVTFSIRPDDPLDLDQLDELVQASDYGSRSAYIRAAILDDEEIDEDTDD